MGPVRVKPLPVNAPVTTVPPVPVTVPLETSRRGIVNAVGPELSVPLLKPTTPVLLRLNTAVGLNWWVPLLSPSFAPSAILNVPLNISAPPELLCASVKVPVLTLSVPVF